MHVYLCVSYWFNFPLYVTVNECYLNKATEAHKSACVEIVDVVKFLLTLEVERADGAVTETGAEKKILPLLSITCDIFKV